MTFIRKAAIFVAAFMAAGAALAADAPTYKEFAEGNPKAKVTVIEYASLTCPHCARFFQNSYPSLKKEYIDTGKINFIFRDFPTPPETLAVAGAVLARCAPADGGKKMLALMFENQGTWIKEPEKTLRSYAKTVGMNDAAFDACLKNEGIQKGIMDAIAEAVSVYQISSTPSFVIGDEVVAGEDYEPVKAAIDKALGILKS